MAPRKYDRGARAEAVNATRRRILTAAIELFAEEGFAGTSVDRVAARADVTRATVYHHVGSKRGLLEELAAEAAGQAGLADVIALGERAATVDDVHGVLRAFTRFWAAHAVVFRNITGLSGVDPDAAAVVEQRDRNRHAGLSALVERLADRDLLASDVSRPQAVEGLWLLTSYPVFDHLHRRSGFSVEQTASLLTRLADALLADHRTAPAPHDRHQPARTIGDRHGA